VLPHMRDRIRVLTHRYVRGNEAALQAK